MVRHIVHKNNAVQSFCSDNRTIQLIGRIGFLIIALCMFYFSSQHGEESNHVSDSVAQILRIESDGSYLHVSVQPLLLGFNLRKFAHMGIFAMLGFCAFLSFPSKGNDPGFLWETENELIPQRAWKAVLISYLYACFDEFHQMLVPDRFGSFSDTVIDLLGVLLGVIFIVLLEYRLMRDLRTAAVC